MEAEKKIALTRHLLDHAGIGSDRLLLAWVSSAEAQRFVHVATTIVEDVRKAGPLDREGLSLQLEAVRRTLDSEYVRWTVGKQRRIVRDGDVYGRPWDEDSFTRALQRISDTEYEKSLIYTALKHGSTSVRDIGAATGLPLARISHHLVNLEQAGEVAFQRMVEHKPEYAAV